VVVAEAYARCARIAATHYENFPVASRLLPKDSRPHVAAVYAFARAADDIADEGSESQASRIERLEAWQWRLHEAAAGRVAADGSDAEPIFMALADTITKFGLETQLFEDLLSAFCQDVIVKRYETWADVLDYCRRSANPVGRLVLRIARQHDTERDRRSDAVCSALQLANFWQDFAIDWRRGRLYVPREIVAQHGADERALEEDVWTIEWQETMRDVVARTRALFAEGRPLMMRINGRLRHELRATWLGGSKILDKIEDNDFDVWSRRPKLGLLDAAAISWGVFRWK
jgi:squalene synthase HpnC